MNEITLPVALPGADDTLMWADPSTVEHAALNQIRDVASMPWTAKVRVMPDVHYGKGATVGSVIAMRGAVSPSAVGVDIGCGMSAIPTSLTVSDLPESLSPLRSSIEAAVPVGFNSHDGAARLSRTDRALVHRDSLMSRFGELRAPKISDRHDRAASQCGSLGGGNHFIEIVSDTSDRIWVTLHSGSRNIGKELAERHITEAKSLDHNAPFGDLAVFLSGTPQMTDYLHDLYWAQDYALANREVMMALIRGVLRQHFPQITFGDEVACHHNYVAEEVYDGEELIVTRKGAIRAAKGDLGIIPGSMGTGSFIVRGLGNEDGLCSASHGAGRKMSRNAAKRTFTVDDLATQTSGVECRKDAGVVDEIPGAYKDLAEVIAAQSQGPSPLVEVVQRLTTLLCVKG